MLMVLSLRSRPRVTTDELGIRFRASGKGLPAIDLSQVAAFSHNSQCSNSLYDTRDLTDFCANY